MSLSVPPEGRVRYDDAFKLEALKRWKTTRRSAGSVAKELGISPATLYTWGREARANGSESAIATSGHLIRELQNEIARLREENERLRQHREILKKTLAILSEPQRAAAMVDLLRGHGPERGAANGHHNGNGNGNGAHRV